MTDYIVIFGYDIDNQSNFHQFFYLFQDTKWDSIFEGETKTSLLSFFPKNNNLIIKDLDKYCFPSGQSIILSNEFQQLLPRDKNLTSHFKTEQQAFDYFDIHQFKYYATTLTIYEKCFVQSYQNTFGMRERLVVWLPKLQMENMLNNKNNLTFNNYNQIYMQKSMVLLSKYNNSGLQIDFMKFIYKYFIRNRSQDQECFTLLNTSLYQQYLQMLTSQGLEQSEKWFQTEFLQNNQILLSTKESNFIQCKSEHIFEFYLSFIVSIPKNLNGFNDQTLELITFVKQENSKLKECKLGTFNPQNSYFALEDVSYNIFFKYLNMDHLSKIIGEIFLEKQIIFISDNSQELFILLEFIMKLIYPFQWTSIYMPYLPSTMIKTLQALVPYIVGINCKTYEQVITPLIKYKKFLGQEFDGFNKQMNLQSQIPNTFIKKIQMKTKNIQKLFEKCKYEEAFLKLQQSMLNFMIEFINNLYAGLFYQEKIDALDVQYKDVFSVDQYCKIFPQESENFMRLFVQNSMVIQFIILCLKMFKKLIEDVYNVEFGETQLIGNYLNTYLTVVKKIAKKQINSNPYFTLNNQFEIEQDSQINNALQCHQNRQKIHINNYLIRYLAFMESKDIIKVTDEFNTDSDEPIYSNQLLPKFYNQRLVQVPIQPIQAYYEEKPKVKTEVEYIYKEKVGPVCQQVSQDCSINKITNNTILHINNEQSGKILQELPIGQNIQVFKYPKNPYQHQKQYKYFIKKKGQDLLGLLNEQKELLQQQNNKKNSIFNRKPQQNLLDFKNVSIPQVKKETIQSELLFSFNQQIEANMMKDQMVKRNYDSEIGVQQQGKEKNQRKRCIFQQKEKINIRMKK